MLSLVFALVYRFVPDCRLPWPALWSGAAVSALLFVIGKSALATIKLKGWFAPKAAAQINRRDDNFYFIGAADKTPKVNGRSVSHPVQLSSGDIIEVAGIRMEFIFRD